MIKMLDDAGFDYIVPKGAYYMMSDITRWGFDNDVEMSKFLVTEIGVATVPGSSFFSDPKSGKDLIRFTFCKKPETLAAAEERLMKVRELVVGR